MKKRNYITRFSDLKMSRKLALGFFAVLLVTLFITGFSFYAMEKIQEKNEKVRVAVELVNELSTARLQRTIYQYNHSEKAEEANQAAMQEINRILEQMSVDFRWSSTGQGYVDRIKAAATESIQMRNVFVSQVKTVAKIVQQMDTQQLYQQSEAIYQAYHDNSLPPELQQSAMLLAFEFSYLDSEIYYYLLNPDEKRQGKITALLAAALTDGEYLLPLLPAARQKPLREALATLDKIKNSLAEYYTQWGKQEALSHELTATVGKLNTEIYDFLKYQKGSSDETTHFAEWQIGIFALIGVLLSIMISWVITRSITRPLGETLKMAERVSAGDLTNELHSDRRDEIGLLMQAVGQMNQNLKKIISQVRSGVSSVAQASAEIAAGNDDLSSRTEQQAAAVVESAASMEQLTSTVKQNSENVHYARKLTDEASDNVNRGGKTVNEVIVTMRDIRESSQRINEITSVINGIAFQTNILALNAAVEAARAGEQGRGFAVVAGEVRNLAQRSSLSAKEIEVLIKESVAKVDRGFELVESAGRIMTNTVGSVDKVREIMGEIATATDEQSRGIAQISQAMAEMDTTTQQNAALVEESSVAAQSLESQAEELDKVVSVFRLPEGESVSKKQKLIISNAPTHSVAGRDAGWETF